MAKAKTSGVVHKVFSGIGQIGGNTVKALVMEGKILQVLRLKGVVTDEMIRQSGFEPSKIDEAHFDAAQARSDLNEIENTEVEGFFSDEIAHKEAEELKRSRKRRGAA